MLHRLWLVASLAVAVPAGWSADQDWAVYNGDVEGQHYSTLAQINRDNVAQMRPVWRFDSAEAGDPETNPLIIGRTLFAYTPTMKVVALDAATGVPRWTFHPGIHGTGPARGFSYYRGSAGDTLFAGVMNYLYALDPQTGRPRDGFGDHGRIDLRAHLIGDAARFYVSQTTPGMLYKDLIIVGFRTSEVKPAPPADIRAYDVHTGALRWAFHTIPHPGEFGAKTWPAGAWRKSGSANNWAGFTLDAARGIVYAPTGSAVDDFYGGDRLGDDLFADTLLALDAATGKRLWHFQEVHHDLWDRDLPSSPVLVTLHRDGKAIDAIAQTTKQGYVYVFDRVTGAPLFPIDEVPYPKSDVPGEVTAATQPRPRLPEPIARQRLTEDLLTQRTPAVHAWALDQFRSFRSAGQFLPLAVGQPTVVFPGFDGGAEWGGPALDPDRGILYVNANDVAWTGKLVPDRPVKDPGGALYQSMCSACHGEDRKGSEPSFPDLTNIGSRYSAAQIEQIVKLGRGRMPPFGSLSGPPLDALVQFLRTGHSTLTAAQHGADVVHRRFSFGGYDKFLDPDGYPAVAPPWGTLNAIDLNTGAYLWKVPLGNYPELVAQGLADTGSENYGGPVLTASGLLFIGATMFDHTLRAFDARTGALVWSGDLPYSGTATPATYMIDGRQYVVIATNNSRNKKAPQGSAYVAFALPPDPANPSPR